MFISCTVKIVFICVYYTSPMFFFIPELLKSFTELTTFSDTIYSLTHTHTYTQVREYESQLAVPGYPQQTAGEIAQLTFPSDAELIVIVNFRGEFYYCSLLLVSSYSTPTMTATNKDLLINYEVEKFTISGFCRDFLFVFISAI